MASVDKSRLNALTIRFLLGTLSPEEHKELDALLSEDATGRQRFEQRVNSGELRRNLAAYLEAETHRTGIPSPAKRRLPLYRYLPYAAAVLLAAGVLFFWKSRNHAQDDRQVSVAGMNTDFLPGSGRAMLTLEDGSQVDLDSLKAGGTSKQGDASVFKAGDALISYAANELIESAEKGRETPLKYHRITTPVGGTYQVVLPDGSAVWLNAASGIRFPTSFAPGRREVEISGEVYFDIKQNSSAPFYVKSAGAFVEVLGTSFNMKMYDNEPAAEVTLLKGSVMVSAGSNDNNVPYKPAKLTAGQQAQVFPGRSPEINNSADLQQVIAWKTGFFKFSNADIRSIMREIERWYDIEISYQITDYNMRYGGRISRSLKLSELLRLLEGNNIHHYKMEGRKLIVLP